MFSVKSIEIEDRERFNRYYAINRYPNSEYNFSNLFMWEKGYNLRFCECDGFLVVMGDSLSTGKYCTFPVGSGDLKRVIDKMVDHFEQSGLELNMRPLTAPMRDALEAIYPGRFTFTEKREYHDYVYRVEDLIALKGSKLHAKKNHFNSFISSYDYHYEEITPGTVEEAKEAVLDFIDSRGGDDSERMAVCRMFDHYQPLGVTGAMLRVDGKVVAVTVGENHHGTALIHIEKADTSYKGAYAAINKLFLENVWRGCEWVNREEDMGIEGLRKAKLSYQPAFLIEKYAVALK